MSNNSQEKQTPMFKENWGKFFTLENFNKHIYYVPTLLPKFEVKSKERILGLDNATLFQGVAEIIVNRINLDTDYFFQRIGGVEVLEQFSHDYFERLMNYLMREIEYCVRNNFFGQNDRADSVQKITTGKYDSLSADFLVFLRDSGVLGIKTQQQMDELWNKLSIGDAFYTKEQIKKLLELFLEKANKYTDDSLTDFQTQIDEIKLLEWIGSTNLRSPIYLEYALKSNKVNNKELRTINLQKINEVGYDEVEFGEGFVMNIDNYNKATISNEPVIKQLTDFKKENDNLKSLVKSLNSNVESINNKNLYSENQIQSKISNFEAEIVSLKKDFADMAKYLKEILKGVK